MASHRPALNVYMQVQENVVVQILAWLCEDSCSAVLRFACADSLSALASDSTDVGLGIARAWLGDLLVHLTRNVKAHHSIRQVRHIKQACPLLYRTVLWSHLCCCTGLKMHRVLELANARLSPAEMLE